MIDCEFLRFNCDLSVFILVICCGQLYFVAYNLLWFCMATCSNLQFLSMQEYAALVQETKAHCQPRIKIGPLRISVSKLQHPKPWLVKVDIFIEFHRFINII